MITGPPSILGKRVSTMVSFALVLGECLGQGTMTLTFEGQPRGTLRQTGPYYEGNIKFRAVPMGALYLSGSGVSGYPDNGTGYLIMPDHDYWNNGLEFGSTDGVTLFDLVSFDAAEEAGLGPTVLTFVGYKPRIMGPITAVTNIFTLDGVNDGTGPLEDFQTFYPDSSFVSLLWVDVYAQFSLDNLVISGVPEPRAATLALLGAVCALWFRWLVRRRHA
jgi:hypothetical protein